MKIRDLQLDAVLARIRSATERDRLRRIGHDCEVRYYFELTRDDRNWLPGAKPTKAWAWWEAAAKAYRRAA